jgi:hypothetical protein
MPYKYLTFVKNTIKIQFSRYIIALKPILIFFLFVFPFLAFAQKKEPISHDIGIFGGASYYLGDINPTKHLYKPLPVYGAFYRLNFNKRFSLRAGFNYAKVQAFDNDFSDPAQKERNLDFKSNIYEGHLIGEFNYKEFQIGNSKYRFTPFTFVGLSYFKFNPKGRIGSTWTELQPLSTEGQGTSLNPDKKQYSHFSFAIPFGLGFETVLYKRFGIGIEWGGRYTFTDYLDDVSGTYVNKQFLAKEVSRDAAFLSDKSTAKVDNTGKQRGNSKLKDWYNFLGVFIIYEIQFYKKCSAYK